MFWEEKDDRDIIEDCLRLGGLIFFNSREEFQQNQDLINRTMESIQRDILKSTIDRTRRLKWIGEWWKFIL